MRVQGQSLRIASLASSAAHATSSTNSLAGQRKTAPYQDSSAKTEHDDTIARVTDNHAATLAATRFVARLQLRQQGRNAPQASIEGCPGRGATRHSLQPPNDDFSWYTPPGGRAKDDESEPDRGHGRAISC